MTGRQGPAGPRVAGRSPAHGFCDDETTRRLLRSRPPRQALDWAVARLGGAAYHPWADVVAIIGFLDDLREDWGREQFLVEDMLGRAVAELGPSGRSPREPA